MMNTMRKSISLLLALLLTFSLVSVATAEGNTVLEGVYDMEKNDFGMETFYHFNADGTYSEGANKARTIRVYRSVNVGLTFRDLFAKLALCYKP